MSTLDEARAAKAMALDVFSAIGSVVGVGITRVGDGYGVKINLATAPTTPAPPTVEGVPVRVEVVGAVRKRLRKRSAKVKPKPRPKPPTD